MVRITLPCCDMALNVMQKDTSKGPLRGKRKRASWDENYLKAMLALF